MLCVDRRMGQLQHNPSDDLRACDDDDDFDADDTTTTRAGSKIFEAVQLGDLHHSVGMHYAECPSRHMV
jgi:hypothetical protein